MKNYYFVSGLGQGKSKALALSKALEKSQLSQVREMVHSYYLPKEAEFIMEGAPEGVADVIIERMEGEKGDVIGVAMLVGDVYRKGKKEKTVLCKQGGPYQEGELRQLLREELQDLCEEGQEIRNERFYFQGMKVEEAFGSVCVGLGFSHKKEMHPFLGKQTEYEQAKVVIAPVAYAYPLSQEDMPSLSLLAASRGIEDYDIETDRQLSSIGVHTRDLLSSKELPDQFVERMTLVAKELFRDQKLPIFVGVDQTVTIGVMQALCEVVGDFSVLHLGAATQSRPSFDGSKYSQACAMRCGMELAKEVVQVGVRTTSNREKRDLQYDKIFFALDIFGEKDDYWMDDVCEELGDYPVYVTIDANVFDPSVMMSRKPDPMGLSYQHVVKLIKRLSQKKQVLGLDFTGLHPDGFSEGVAARFLYQILCFLTKN